MGETSSKIMMALILCISHCRNYCIVEICLEGSMLTYYILLWYIRSLLMNTDRKYAAMVQSPT